MALFFTASALPDRLADFKKGSDLLDREINRALPEANQKIREDNIKIDKAIAGTKDEQKKIQ